VNPRVPEMYQLIEPRYACNGRSHSKLYASCSRILTVLQTNQNAHSGIVNVVGQSQITVCCTSLTYATSRKVVGCIPSEVN
jgi:hypothetical protein